MEQKRSILSIEAVPQTRQRYAEVCLRCLGDKYPGKGDRFHERNKGKF